MNTSASPALHRRCDVAIMGDGVVGLTLALLLAQDRQRVLLVGGGPSSEHTDVRAYAINHRSRALLQSVRAWPDAQIDPNSGRVQQPSTAVTAMRVWGDQGGELRFSADGMRQEALNWVLDVPVLLQRLREAVGFQAGIERLSVSELPPQTLPLAALTVVCEGRRSLTRDQLGFEYLNRPYPHHALATRLRCQSGHGGEARQWFANGEVMALLPLDGQDGQQLALVWSMPSAQAERWRQAPAAELAAAVQARCGALLGEMQVCAPVHSWPLALARARHWIGQGPHGSVVLAGDAAHAMHPLAGQGLNLGLADASELARVLREREYWRGVGERRLLRRYERARQAETAQMGWLTDGLFGLFGHSDSRVQLLRNWGLQNFDRLGALKRWAAEQAMGQAH